MLYLGVDLGGTNIKAALVNSEGEILCEAGHPDEPAASGGSGLR